MHVTQPPEVRYPTEQGQDAIPMIKHLKYKDVFRPVMQQVSPGNKPFEAAARQHRNLPCAG